ncbi:MAG: phospholipase [Gemmatimonadetes bacterium]|nr:phospholipase [Gemmatimonadota bacterium]
MAGVERHLEVVRTARYWTLGDDVASPSEVWFVLHGYRQLAGRFLARFAAIDDGTRRIIAPEGLSRFYVGREAGRHGPASVVGATWMTREDRDREIHDYVRYLDRLAEVSLAELEPEIPVVVLGFSQGVATAARWTTLGAMRPQRLILWGDFLPPDLDGFRAVTAWADTEVLLVRGADDGVFADEDLLAAERQRLEAVGLRLPAHTYVGGHDVLPEVLAAVATRSGPFGA